MTATYLSALLSARIEHVAIFSKGLKALNWSLERNKKKLNRETHEMIWSDRTMREIRYGHGIESNQD